MNKNRSTGAIMTLGNNKKFREMSLEEQITYYQNRASQLKKKQAEQLAEHHRTIGRIFEQVFGVATGSDTEIEDTMKRMSRMISAYRKSSQRQSAPAPTNQAPAKAGEPESAAGFVPDTSGELAPQGPIKD